MQQNYAFTDKTRGPNHSQGWTTWNLQVSHCLPFTPYLRCASAHGSRWYRGGQGALGLVADLAAEEQDVWFRSCSLCEKVNRQRFGQPDSASDEPCTSSGGEQEVSTSGPLQQQQHSQCSHPIDCVIPMPVGYVSLPGSRHFCRISRSAYLATPASSGRVSD